MKSNAFVFFTGVLLISIVSTAQAEIRAGAFYLTPQVGGYVFEGNQNLDHSPTYGLGLGYALDRRWAGELTFNYIDSEFESGPPLRRPRSAIQAAAGTPDCEEFSRPLPV